MTREHHRVGRERGGEADSKARAHLGGVADDGEQDGGDEGDGHVEGVRRACAARGRGSRARRGGLEGRGALEVVGWWDGVGGYVVVVRLRAFDGLDDDVREDRDGDSERG